MFFILMFFLAVMPSLCAESQRYGAHKKALAVQQIPVIKQDTDLIKAVKARNKKTIKKLLKKNNVNINELDYNGKTALDFAVEYREYGIAVLLGQYGGKVTTLENQLNFKTIFKKKARHYILGFFIGLAIAVFIAFPFSMFLLIAGAMSISAGYTIGFNIALGFIALETYAFLYVLSLPSQASLAYYQSRNWWMLS